MCSRTHASVRESLSQRERERQGEGAKEGGVEKLVDGWRESHYIHPENNLETFIYERERGGKMCTPECILNVMSLQ